MTQKGHGSTTSIACCQYQSQNWIALHCLTGDVQVLSREDVILNLEDSPLPDIARGVLVHAAAAPDV